MEDGGLRAEGWRLHVCVCASLLTFGKQAGGTGGHMATEEPTITKVVVALDEFDAVALGEAQLIGAAGNKVMDDEQNRAGRDLERVRGLTSGHDGVLSEGWTRWVLLWDHRSRDGRSGPCCCPDAVLPYRRIAARRLFDTVPRCGGPGRGAGRVSS